MTLESCIAPTTVAVEVARPRLTVTRMSSPPASRTRCPTNRDTISHASAGVFIAPSRRSHLSSLLRTDGNIKESSVGHIHTTHDATTPNASVSRLMTQSRPPILSEWASSSSDGTSE